MNYPVPRYGVVATPIATKSTGTIISIVVCVVIIVLIILGLIAIGLGVGLGVGLRTNNDNSTSSKVLAAPTVNCIYNSTGGCGCAAIKPSFQSTARIYQGYTAVANSWPWIVAIFMHNPNTFCSGFLVDYQYVVTAAHCVDNMAANTITVYAGIQKISLASSGQSRAVSVINIHPAYSSSTFANDIAVLKLETAFTSSATVALCCITSSTSLPSMGENGVIAGWGKTSSNSGSSNDLLQAVIQVTNFTSCKASQTDVNQFCASYTQTGPCFGDSGGPFMTSVNNLWACTGIVSTGIRCGDPTVFIRISSYASFINEIISV